MFPTDIATAKVQAASTGRTVPYGTFQVSGQTMLSVANPNGTSSTIPIRSATAPYTDPLADLAMIGIVIDQGTVGAALAQFGNAGGAAVALPIPTTTASNMNPQDVVRQVYLELLGREPDPAGMATWASALANGMYSGFTIETLYQRIKDSAEYKTRQAQVAATAATAASNVQTQVQNTTPVTGTATVGTSQQQTSTGESSNVQTQVQNTAVTQIAETGSAAVTTVSNFLEGTTLGVSNMLLLAGAALVGLYILSEKQ